MSPYDGIWPRRRDAKGHRDYAEKRLVEEIRSLLAIGFGLEDDPVTTTANRVLGIPTMQVYRGGELRGVIVGARSKAALLRELAEVLPESA